MKAIFTLFGLLFSFSAYSQQTITANITHDNLQREYILYVPQSYTGDEAVPLIFNFHGYTSNAQEQMVYGDFRAIADTANFILVHPEGTLFNGNTHWNVGGFTTGSTVDDVGFTAALLDTLIDQYNINTDRVYSTGMSNGGFMSFVLACELSDRIAAIASVTGSMTPETTANCDAIHPMPVMQIHGTADAVVPYNGAVWTQSVSNAIDYWVNHNNTADTPITTEIEDVETNDGSTVEHIVYTEGDNGATVEHFKITGGAHTWPSTVFVFPGTNLDINASVEIWKFFNRYDINGLIETTSIKELKNDFGVQIAPNPTANELFVALSIQKNMSYELFNILGQSIQKGQITAGQATISLSTLPPNMYYLKIGKQLYKVMKI